MSRGIFVMVLAATGQVSLAHADDDPVARFRLEAPFDCPEDSQLRDMVIARLGRDPFRDEAEHTISVSVTSDERGVRGALELVDAAGGVLGTRVLDAPPRRCDELMEALAVAIALALDSTTGLLATAAGDAHSAVPENETGSDDRRGAPPATTTVARSSPTRARRRSPGQRAPPTERTDALLGIAGSGFVAVGRTIDPAAGGAIGLRLHFDAFTVGLDGAIYAQVEETNAAGASIEMMHVGVTVIGCVAVVRIVELCVPVHVGMLEARSVGIAGDPARSVTAHVGARLGVDFILLPELRLTPWLEANAGIVSPSVSIDGTAIWSAPIVSGLFGVSLELLP